MCHEAIEQALQAFLISKGRHYQTHSIFWLARTAAKLDERFSGVRDDAWTLDTVYSYARYPFGTPARAPREFFTDESDAREAIDVAKGVLSIVCDTIGAP
jgi:HEPN domain-containing protein